MFNEPKDVIGEIKLNERRFFTNTPYINKMRADTIGPALDSEGESIDFDAESEENSDNLRNISLIRSESNEYKMQEKSHVDIDQMVNTINVPHRTSKKK